MREGVSLRKEDDDPKLVPRTVTAPCGYGARSIALSEDQAKLFVGCKDGSITIVDISPSSEGPAAKEYRIAVDSAVSRPAGVRSMLHFHGEWLLVGSDLGQLSLLRWSSEGMGKTHLLLESPISKREKAWAPVTLVERWSNSEIMVSYRNSDTQILPIKISPNGELPFVAGTPRTLIGVQALCSAVRLDRQRALLVSESGIVWKMEGLNDPEPSKEIWERYERPGFISDVTIARQDLQDLECKGVFVATDSGVYLLRWEPQQEVSAKRLHLPGVAGMCMAVSYAFWQNHSYLWVSDLGGDVHLFWNYQQGFDPARSWRRSGFRLESSQVMRSIACVPTKLNALVIGQACRNDKVVITSYSPGGLSPDSPPEQVRVADLLSWGSWKQLEEKTRSTRPDREHEWCPEAIFADFLEQAGGDLEQITHFLANPDVGLTESILDEIYDREHPQRGREAIVLWTQCLLGIIHRRMRNRREQQYFGVIRWLRRLGQSLEEKAGSERPDRKQWNEQIHLAIEECIQQTRKWGIFGPTYLERREILSPIAALDQQGIEERQLDNLVYNTLIFARQVDIEAEFPAKRSEILLPQDVQFLCSGDPERALLAVSWEGSPTEVYARSGEDWTRLALTGSVPARKILLGTLKNTAYLLEAPSRRDNGEVLLLRWLAAGRDQASPATAVLDGGELVYSLLELDAGLVVAGLEGVGEALSEHRGHARVLPIRVAEERLSILRSKSGAMGCLPAGYPELQSLKRNPVLSLATDRNHPSTAGDYVFVAGCGDGQIWRVRLVVEGDEFQTTLTKVGRLASPVRALSFRRLPDGTERIVAGGADGTIVAYQKVIRGYATLWATKEEGPVAAIFAVETPTLYKHAAVDNDRIVLVLTEQGMAVSILDSLEVAPLKRPSKHQRVKVPGERLGRIRLNTNVFGAAWLGVEGLQEKFGPKKFSAVARFAIATGEGKLRVLTLHYPKHTSLRQQMFLQTCRLWFKTLIGEDRKLRSYLLRRTEAMHSAAPELSSILVRWILPAKPTSRTWEQRSSALSHESHPGPSRQWIPRHLQPLLDLEESWAKGEPLPGKLLETLRAARSVGDVRLFKEILEVVLNRANHQIFRRAMESDEVDFAPRFAELLRDLDKISGAWLGAPDNLETKMRIVIAKNLVDGDTLWSLANSMHKPGKPLQDVLELRIRQLQFFLGAGDPLLAIETLRAANLAVTRACRRLAPAEQLNWDALAGYYAAVGDLAARAAHSAQGELGEALLHEICRAYALGMLACPGWTLRLTCWISEADLPERIKEQIHLQIDLLEVLLGRSMPPDALEIFLAASGRAPGTRSYDRTRIGKERRERWLREKDRIGPDNAQFLVEGELYESIVDEVYSLARTFSHEAGSVDLRTLLHLYRRCQSPAPRQEGGREQFYHSRHFWEKALAELFEQVEAYGLLGRASGSDGAPVRPRPIAPDLVLFSKDLATWCNVQIEKLQNLRGDYKIFEPQLRFYRDALAVLERVASGFRHGASLQKNVVLGVLGHGLLELLDEHLLHLWEVAQALDPERTWNLEDGQYASPRRSRTSAAARFADYLLNSAQQAEDIPRNLRSLQGLLCYPEEPDEHQDPTKYDFASLLDGLSMAENWSFSARGEKAPINARTYHFLHFTVHELAFNQKTHGKSWNSSIDVDRRPDGSPCAKLEFRYPDDQADRIRQILDNYHDLQRPVPPRTENGVRSHGLGLYLANLAASSVGWKLEAEALDRKAGHLIFWLYRKDKEVA